MTDWIQPSTSWSFDDNAKQRFQAVYDTVKGDSLLDVGCRDGTFALTYARDHPNVRVVGIDTDSSSVDYANLKAIADGIENVAFFLMDIFDPNGVTTLGTFDSVVCMETLEHLPPNRVQEANDNLIKYCKKDGRLIVTVPANSHISDPEHATVFYREMFHGQVTWIRTCPFLWIAWYKDFSSE